MKSTRDAQHCGATWLDRRLLWQSVFLLFAAFAILICIISETINHNDWIVSAAFHTAQSWVDNSIKILIWDKGLKRAQGAEGRAQYITHFKHTEDRRDSESESLQHAKRYAAKLC